MPISVYILILLPMLAAPVLTYRMEDAAYHWQSRQIALDNAAIRMGKADRSLMRSLVRSNRELRALEVAHHPAHACAHSPAANPACLAADEGFELRIRLKHRAIYGMAVEAWQAAAVESRAALVDRGENIRQERCALPPIHAVSCPVCGLEIYWERDHTGFRSTLMDNGEPTLGVAVSVDGASLLLPSHWDYELSRPSENVP